MTRRSRFAAPLAAAALAVLAATGCTSQGTGGMGTSATGMGPSAPAAGRTDTAGAADARVGAPGERSQERGAPMPPAADPTAPVAPSADASGTRGVPPPIAQADDETLRACATYRQMMAGKTPLEQQATWALHLQRVHGISDPQEAAMHQRNVERTCAQVMPGSMR